MIRFILATIMLTAHQTGAFAPGSLHFNRVESKSMPLRAIKIPNAQGCAAVPFEKKKVAVFGAGGYLGAVAFGFLQRASSLYGTGIAGGASPRAIGATRTTSEALNKVLTPCFKLAYAGEDLVRLVDTTNKDYIKDRLKSFDAAILGTVYQLESRTVTGNTYEKTPNDRTFDFYLDERYGCNENGAPGHESDYHLQMFETAIHACKESGIQHLVIVETPRTQTPQEFINILEREEMKYTYIRAKHLTKDKTYTFEKGVKAKMDIKVLPKSGVSSPANEPKNEGDAIFREDLAALVVQSLMSLNWEQSRILEVSASENIASDVVNKKNQRFDQDWCPNSNVYAELLSAIN